MSGISSKAALFGNPENRKKFNGIEFNNDFALNQYEAFYRTLDPQIGRFLQIDPKIESAEAWSPYSAMLDNPIRYADPLGDSSVKPTQSIPFSRVKAMHSYFKSNAAKHSAGKADDCITCHNKGMKIVTNNPSLQTGSTASETRGKMQKQGYAGETKKFGFNDANGNTAKSAPQATNLKESVGNYATTAADNVKAGTSAVFGVSVMDGYHTMTLSVTKNEYTIPILDEKVTEYTYTLSDQGTLHGTIGKGNLTFSSAAALDSHLTSYVKSQSAATTSDGSSYPAKIELHQISTEGGN